MGSNSLLKRSHPLAHLMWGPRRVTRVELETFFSKAWMVDRIRETHLETRRGESIPGWLATAHRVLPGVR